MELNLNDLFPFLTDQVILQQEVILLLKMLYLLAMLGYVGFAVVVLRQVELMRSSFVGLFDLPMKTIAWLHLLASMLIFGVGMILL